MADKKINIVILYVANRSKSELIELSDVLHSAAKNSGYQFVITNEKLESIPKNEFLKAVEELKLGR